MLGNIPAQMASCMAHHDAPKTSVLGIQNQLGVRIIYGYTTPMETKSFGGASIVRFWMRLKRFDKQCEQGSGPLALRTSRLV